MKRVIEPEPVNMCKVPDIPGDKNRIKRKGRCRNNRIRKGDGCIMPDLNRTFCNGISEGDAPGAVQQVPGLDQTFR